MHLGNGAITTECAVLGWGIALAGCWTTTRGKHQAQPSVTPSSVTPSSVGAWGAFLFAAQMMNLPVGTHSSAHLVGGVLLAKILGARGCLLVMASVLALQAMLLGDGSLLAWGVNFCNLALVPVTMLWLVERSLGSNLWSVAFSSILATLCAAALIPLEVLIGRSIGELAAWREFVAYILSLHISVSVFEALATVGLMFAWNTATQHKSMRNYAGLGLASLAGILICTASSISSILPDAYEAAAERSMAQLLTAGASPWAILTFGELGASLLAVALLIGFCKISWPAIASRA